MWTNAYRAPSVAATRSKSLPVAAPSIGCAWKSPLLGDTGGDTGPGPLPNNGPLPTNGNTGPCLLPPLLDNGPHPTNGNTCLGLLPPLGVNGVDMGPSPLPGLEPSRKLDNEADNHEPNACQECFQSCGPENAATGAVPDPEAEMACRQGCECSACLLPETLRGEMRLPPHCEEAQSSGATHNEQHNEQPNEADNQPPDLCHQCHESCMPHMQDPGAVMDPIILDPDCHMNCDCTDCLQPDSA